MFESTNWTTRINDPKYWESILKQYRAMERSAIIDSGTPPRGSANVDQDVHPIPDDIKPAHYPSKNDPIKYSIDNKLGAVEFNVVKYVTRWKDKGGLTDLKKARQCLDRLIDRAPQLLRDLPASGPVPKSGK